MAVLGANAKTEYVTAGSGGQSYSSLVNTEIALWTATKCRRKGVDSAFVTTGWDPRPRIDHPTYTAALSRYPSISGRKWLRP